MPSSTVELHFHDCEFHLCLQYWLGIQIIDQDKCPVCGAKANGSRDHQVTYRGQTDLIFHHDSLRDILFSAASSAALAPRKEVPSLIPKVCSKPADVYLP